MIFPLNVEVKQKLRNNLHPCYGIKGFTKNTFLGKVDIRQ